MSQSNDFLSQPLKKPTLKDLSSNPSIDLSADAISEEREKAEIAVSIDKDLLRQISFLTDNPSKVIEVAVRQWLREGGRRDDDLTRNLERNPPVPARGEWND